VSFLQIKLLQKIRILSQEIVRSSTFRKINEIGSIFLAWTVHCILLLNGKQNSKYGSGKITTLSVYYGLIHNTVNICLFPPLFFFYGLYYTDVLSALSVLHSYKCYLERQNSESIIFVGLLSLLFRQTNIFWVSLFLGGLAFCRAIPKARPNFDFPSQPTLYTIVQSSWQQACAYDPRISLASFEGSLCPSIDIDSS